MMKLSVFESIIQQAWNKLSGRPIVLEVKFLTGVYSAGSQTTDNVSILSYKQFKDLSKSLNSLPHTQNNIKTSYLFKSNGSYTKYTYSTKTKELHYQYNHYIPEYNVSVTVFLEYDSTKESEQTNQTAIETIYYYPGGIEVKCTNTGFETEASIVLRELSINNFFSVFSSVYQVLYPSEIPYLQDEALAIQQYVFKELGIYNMTQLPKARNITYDDLQYGKLVGGHTYYKMSYRLKAPMSLLVAINAKLWYITQNSVRLLSDNIYDNVTDGIRLTVMSGQMILNTLQENSYWAKTSSKYLYFIEDVYIIAGQKLINNTNLEERLNYALGQQQYLSTRIPSILTVYRKSMYGINTTRDFYKKQSQLQTLLNVFKNNGIPQEGILFLPNNTKFTDLYAVGYSKQDISKVPQHLIFRDNERKLMDFAIKWKQTIDGAKATLLTYDDIYKVYPGWELSQSDFKVQDTSKLVHDIPNYTVVEGYYSPKLDKFILDRIRDDRKYPNSPAAIKNLLNLTLNGPSQNLFFGRSFELLNQYLLRLLDKLPYTNYIYHEDNASPIDQALIKHAANKYIGADEEETVFVTNNMLATRIKIGNIPKRIVAICVDKLNVLQYFSNPTTFTLLTPANFTLFTAGYNSGKFNITWSSIMQQEFVPFDIEKFSGYKILTYHKCDGELLLNPDETVLSRFFSLIVLEKI